MRIAKIYANNFQGLSIAQNLASVNVIYGDNFSGKSAIIKALRLGLTGKLPPPIGVQGVFKLAGNPDGEGTMNIDLETDTGRKIELSWSKNAKGSVASKGAVPLDLKMPDLLCEPREFFKKTSAERIKTIFAACDISKSGFSKESITNRFSEIECMPVDVAETTLNVVESLITKTFIPGRSIQEACEMLLATLKVSAKTTKDDAANISGAFAGLRAKIGQARPGDQAEAIKTLESEIRQKTGENISERRAAERALESAKSKFAGVGIIGIFSEALENITTELEASITETNTELEAARAKKSHDTAAIPTKFDALNKSLTSIKDTLLQNMTTRKAATNVLESVLKLSICAKCKKKLRDDHAANQAALDEASDALKNQKDELAGQLDKLSIELETKTQSNIDRQGTITALETRNANNTQRLGDIKTVYNNYLTASKALSNFAAPVDTSTLETKLTELRTKQDEFNQYKSNLKKRDELSTELAVKQCQESVLKKVTEIVLEEQEKVMTFAFNEVLTVAKHFTDGLINSPIEFANGELGRRVSELDKANGNMAPVGSWISHECFSGTEELLSYAGFSIALAQNAPMKIIMMDELGRIVPELKLAVIERLADLVAGGIVHQAILIDVQAPPDAWLAAAGNMVSVIKV